MKEPWPLVVIGAGPAGVSAAVEAARLGFEPLIVDSSGRAGGLIRHAFEVRNFPGGIRSGRDVAVLFAELLEQWEIPVRECRIDSVEQRGPEVLLRDGTESGIEASAVIVATGTEPVAPVIAGLTGGFGGILHASSDSVLQDRSIRRAAVIGGSDAAFDQARYLAAGGVEALVICRPASPQAPPWLVGKALEEGVSLMSGSMVTRILHAGRGAELEIGVRSGTGRICTDSARIPEVTVDALVAAMGRKPRRPGLSIDGSPPRVAVAGDAVGRRGRYLCAAMSDGCLAARSMLDGAPRRGGDE